MKPDPVVDQTLAHLIARRDALSKQIVAYQKQIAEYQEGIQDAGKELAKVEQAIAGLKPLGRQGLLDKAGPAVAAVGVGAAMLLVAMASAQGRATARPSAPELILAVLHEGGQMTDLEVVSRMHELGWSSNSSDRLALVRSYLSRLTQAKQVSRVGPSTYRLAVAQEPSVVIGDDSLPSSGA